jgi:hypothetical protein
MSGGLPEGAPRNDKIRLVILESFDSKQPELIVILLFMCLGFVAGAGTWGGTSGGTRYMTVMSARFSRDAPKSRIAWVPRGIFTSLLFAAFPFIKGWCKALLIQHPLVPILMIVCEISCSLWLLTALSIQGTIEAASKRRVEEFIASPPGKEPQLSAPEPSPSWLNAWEWVNTLLFALIVVTLVAPLIS